MGSALSNSIHRVGLGTSATGALGEHGSCYNTAGIVGPGGTEQSGDHMLTTGAHFQTGAWKWHPTLNYQLNHRKELSVVGPDSLTEDNERRYTQLDLSLRATRLDVFADRAGESGWTWTVGAQGHVKSNSNDTALIDLNAQWIPDADMAGSGGFVRVSHTQGHGCLLLQFGVMSITFLGRQEACPTRMSTPSWEMEADRFKCCRVLWVSSGCPATSTCGA